jgi:hypothetical protein
VGKWAKSASNPCATRVSAILKSGQKVGKNPKKVGKMHISKNPQITRFFQKTLIFAQKVGTVKNKWAKVGKNLLTLGFKPPPIVIVIRPINLKSRRSKDSK